MFSNLNRVDLVNTLKNETFDLLVIGGGITGAGIALDAAARGLKTALVEMQDFGAGTSSRSTKLVHGGLRYLKQFEISVVREVGRERAIVYENGPHVTTPEWMLLPFYKGGTFGKATTSIGLRVYDFLAGVKKEERRTMLSKSETLEREPLLREDGLIGGGYYVEYRTDDARLTMEVMKKAAEIGATALNYAKVTRFEYQDGKIAGAHISDLLTGDTFMVQAEKIVNAAGPWVDKVRELEGEKGNKSIIHSKGVHIVLDQSVFPLKQAIYFEASDGRMIFAVPRDGKAYVGTTDTFYDGDLASPKVEVADREYLLQAIRSMFPGCMVNETHIESSWAGVRPLISEQGKGPSEISRKDEIWESGTGLITIAGGKLTGYRKMAETVIDLVVEKVTSRTLRPCQTASLPISGGDTGGSAGMGEYVKSVASQGVRAGLSQGEAERIARQYGSNAGKLFAILEKSGDEAVKWSLSKSLFARLLYSIDEEMAYTPLDFFYRRTGALLFNINEVAAAKDKVGKYMASVFGWDDSQLQLYMDELDQAINDYAPQFSRHHPDVPVTGGLERK